MGYRGKLAEREKARRLRAEGRTLADIAEVLGVSKSSVSLWVRDVEFQAALPLRRGVRRSPTVRQRRKLAEIEELNQAGVAKVGVLSTQAFLAAGAALYAGEGAKTDGAVKFANSDPGMVRFFCAWLRHFFEINESRLRARLYLHKGLDYEEAVSFWSSVTGIPPTQFSKPYRAEPDEGIRHTKHVYGCLSVGYSCARTHRAVMGLCRALLSCESIPG